MNTDDILVFHRMLTIGKPAKIAVIAEGLQHYRGPIYGMQPLSVPTVKLCVAALTRMGLVERPSKTTYAATWGTFAPTAADFREVEPMVGPPRPALPLLAPILRNKRAFLGNTVETFIDGFLYPIGGHAGITRIDGPALGELTRVGDNYVIRSTLPVQHLAHLHTTKGYSAFRGAENALQIAARKLDGWALSINERPNPKCPVCRDDMEGYGMQTCRPCNRTMNFRRDEMPFCVGHVEAPVDITLIDPAAEQPRSLWGVAKQLDAINAALATALASPLVQR